MTIHEFYVYLDCMVNCNVRMCDECCEMHGYDGCPRNEIGEEGADDMLRQAVDIILNKEHQAGRDSVITPEEIANILTDLEN